MSAGRNRPQVQITLSPVARELLDAASRRTGFSLSAVVDALAHVHAARLSAATVAARADADGTRARRGTGRRKPAG